MARVLTFSRHFPAYHNRHGEPTFFVEKILNQLDINYREEEYLNTLRHLNRNAVADGRLTHDHVLAFYNSLQDGVTQTKHHTIRESMRLKVGEWFSPRCWFGTPYHDPQIIFAPDTQVKSTWLFILQEVTGDYQLNGKTLTYSEVQKVAAHDGLDTDDFELWFKKAFKGQVICFDKNINYTN